MTLAYLGQVCIGIALLLAGAQAVALTRSARAISLSYWQVFFVMLAFGILLYAHITDQFIFLSVTLHSHTAKPFLYKLSGVWGNHEGSMLLLALILSSYGAAVARQVHSLETPYPLAVPLMGFINFSFLLFIALSCDPFTIVDSAPLEGLDLNPLLQDPSLAIHPPILYAGYAGFAVPFTLSVAALIHGKPPSSWPQVARPWVLLAWFFLTLGVGLGSFWAYYELGWGGWWFWDPVENATLLPWLTATALLHTIIAAKASRTLQASTLLLSVMTFALCLFGVVLVRSGLLTSVHTFAVDPERGAFLIILSCFLVGPAIGLFIERFPHIYSTTPTILLSRSGFIGIMALILSVGTATVAMGTMYPLILEAFGQKATVGIPYFNVTFVPMMLPLLLLLGLGPWYTWAGLPASAVRWLAGLVCLTLGSILVACLGFGIRHILGLSAFAGAAWSVIATIGYAFKKRKILSGTILAHLGMGIAVLGMVGSSLGEQETLKAIGLGETVTVGPVSLTLQQITYHHGPNYQAQRAVLQLHPKGSTLMPEKRFYWTQGIVHGESAIQSVGRGRLHHIYVTLGEEYEGNKWSIHAYYKPFINLLWVGIILMVLGGIVAFIKRWRVLAALPLIIIAFTPNALGIEAHEQLSDASLEKRARLLSQHILCPTCQRQSLDESPSAAAVALRSQIRTALRQGKTDEEIRKTLAIQQGDQVITTPPTGWKTSALWLTPWTLLLLALGGYFVKRRRRPCRYARNTRHH